MPACVESGVYNVERGLPWHGLGTANNGFMYASQILGYAMLDWDVEKVPLFVKGGDDPISAIYTKVTRNYGIQRSSDGRVLGVVGEVYEPVQNRDALSFMDNILGSGQRVYDSAWSLRGGRTVAISAELPFEYKMPEGEEIRTYVTASNTHDGSGKVKVIVSPVRVVCMNTLTMATNQAQATWQRKHTTNVMNDANVVDARRVLNLVEGYNKFIAETAYSLLNEKFDSLDMNHLAYDLIIGNSDEEREPSPQAQRRIDTLISVWRDTDNLNNIRYTKWGALQAVTEFADYYGRYHEGLDIHERRAASILGGAAATLKARALDLLTV